MIIRKLTASFGQLQNRSLTLAPGLNIIEAPNEAGKSTWAAFVRAMLYGIDSSDRDKRGYLADKNRYQPWSGAPMEGTMVAEADGRTLVLERGTARSGAPMARFSARDAHTGEELSFLTGENVGSYLTGVEEEVFVRSAFIRQAGLTVDQSPALERRIAALVSSGEEETSYTEAEGRLRAWINRRRHNRSGLLPQLEAEKKSVEDALSRLQSAGVGIAAARAELEVLTDRRAALERELSLHQRRAQADKNARLAEARAELEAAESQRTALQEELNRHGPTPGRETLRAMQGELSRLQTLRAGLRQTEEQRASAKTAGDQAQAELDSWELFRGKTPEEAWEQARADQERCVQAEQRLKKWPASLIGLGILMLLAYAATALVYVLEIPVPIWLMIGVSLALSILSGGVLLWWNRRRLAAVGESEAILSRYGAAVPDEILERAAAYRAAAAAAAQRAEQSLTLERAAGNLTQELGAAQESLLARVNVFAPATDLFGVSAALSRALELWEKHENASIRAQALRRGYQDLAADGVNDAPVPGESLAEPVLPKEEAEGQLSACLRRLDELNAALSRAEGEQASLGDPAVLAARREELSLRCGELEREYAALGAAQEALKNAHMELQARFSPALNARAGEILRGLTDGKYAAVALDRSFQAAVREEDGVLSRSVLSLSQGTADQLYLAVRLSVCELALPREKAAPLILDDALANFDDLRTKAALHYFTEAAEQRQILLFTCHSREREFAAGNPSVHIVRAPIGAE